jgi:hypothetical protein
VRSEITDAVVILVNQPVVVAVLVKVIVSVQ